MQKNSCFPVLQTFNQAKKVFFGKVYFIKAPKPSWFFENFTGAGLKAGDSALLKCRPEASPQASDRPLPTLQPRSSSEVLEMIINRPGFPLNISGRFFRLFSKSLFS